MPFSPSEIYKHILEIKDNYTDRIKELVNYLSELIENNITSENENDQDYQNLLTLLDELKKEETPNSQDLPAVDEKANKTLDDIHKELKLRKAIEDFYINKQLVNIIFKLGFIPFRPMETVVGVAFVDIVNYSFMSKFLSPMENQSVLNGLFSCFNLVLRKHNGYLNKTEGDSLMFHFGGLTDPVSRDLHNEEAVEYIAKELFYTCVEIQRVCFQFNIADTSFIEQAEDEETKESITRAFEIITNLRSDLELAYSLNALYQIRVRIGANIGTVTIGNFGPPGARQWDIIGAPVIEAKRMEASAPIGGLRISKKFFSILEKIGVIKEYYDQFTKEAQETMGYFKDIKFDELFHYKKIYLQDKSNVSFETFSIQVNPSLPETISQQINVLLGKGTLGAERIIELLKYYRGNKFIVNAIESVFIQKNVTLRKGNLLKAIYPNQYALFAEKIGNEERAEKAISSVYSLYDLFCKLGEYQDSVNSFFLDENKDINFFSYSQYLNNSKNYLIDNYDKKQTYTFYKTHFYDYIFPLFFSLIRASLLEYQMNVLSNDDDIELLEEV